MRKSATSNLARLAGGVGPIVIMREMSAPVSRLPKKLESVLLSRRLYRLASLAPASLIFSLANDSRPMMLPVLVAIATTMLLGLSRLCFAHSLGRNHP